ncbi:hypothetical protein Tco_1308393 [Tanacetum coccineum]
MDESICYRCTSDVQRMSRYVIVVHQICSTDESKCYRYTSDVQRMSRDSPAKNSRQELQPRTPAKNSRQELPPNQTIIMVLMVPYEAFVCRCGAEDVVLRESLGKTILDVNFLWKEERILLLVGSLGASMTPIYSPRSSSTSIYSPGSSTPPRYSPGDSTPQSYSQGISRNAECSNCKDWLGKITILEATVEMYMHPEEHTLNSAALLHEVYHDMRKLGLE